MGQPLIASALMTVLTAASPEAQYSPASRPVQNAPWAVVFVQAIQPFNPGEGLSFIRFVLEVNLP